MKNEVVEEGRSEIACATRTATFSLNFLLPKLSYPIPTIFIEIQFSITLLSLPPPFSVFPNMKREGRQHGMVRAYRILPSPWNPRPQQRFVNRFDSPPTAGVFTKVSSKPTNHSKFTGMCGRQRCSDCHLHPVCKSKGKTKGTQKLRSSDLVSHKRLISLRVADGGPGFNFSRVSATEILDHLNQPEYSDDYDYDYDYDHDFDWARYLDDGYDSAGSLGWWDEGVENCDLQRGDGLASEEAKEIEGGGIEVGGGSDESEEEESGFCQVGFVWEQVDGEEEGWCLVHEM